MGIGDEVMTTGLVRVMQEADPRRVKVIYERPRWPRVWDHNPRIARFDERGDFQILMPRTNGLRPYCSAKSPERWAWKAWGPPAGEIYLTDIEKAFGHQHAGQVVLEPNIKAGASPNKRWPWERWRSLVEMLRDTGIQPVQLGPMGTPLIDGCRLVETASIRHAAAVMARAKASVLTEGALHHVAAAVGTPAVVIYGGYISPEVTGYRTQRNLFTGDGLGCGWRKPCACCSEAMREITPERVFDEFKALTC